MSDRSRAAILVSLTACAHHVSTPSEDQAEERRALTFVRVADGLYRDWPVSKGCTPPFAPIWINFMVNRQG